MIIWVVCIILMFVTTRFLIIIDYLLLNNAIKNTFSNMLNKFLEKLKEK